MTIRDLEARDSEKMLGLVLREDKSNITFDLKNKNYNDLIQNRVGATKRILVVILMPKEESEWLMHSVESLIIKKCAYWVCLKSMPPVQDIESTTAIRIPKENLTRCC